MSRLVPTIDQKDYQETDVVTFDYSAMICSGDTISESIDPVVTCEVYKGTDPRPSIVLSGYPQVSGFTVLQQITGGVPGVTYHIRCLVTLTSGREITLACLMPCVRL